MTIPVAKIIDDAEYDLRLKLVAGKDGLGRTVRYSRVFRPGLALAGERSSRGAGRVQLLGRDEVEYLNSLASQRRAEVVARLLDVDSACVVVADKSESPDTLMAECDQRAIPLCASDHLADTLADRMEDMLQEQLGLSRNMHGVLVDVLGVGVLIMGKSGIGKSECALDLVLRGHRLVADDVVMLKKRPPATVFGSCSPIVKHHMEIRGLGIINIKDLYGVSAVRDRKKVELVVELEDWQTDTEYDRLGLDDRSYDLLGVEIPYLLVPVRHGRNTSTLVEVAARNLLLKRQGHHAAREFQAKLVRVISEAADERVLGEVIE